MLFRELETYAVFYKDGVPGWKVLKDIAGTYYLYTITRDGMEHYTGHKSWDPFSFKKWIMPKEPAAHDDTVEIPEVIDVYDIIDDDGNSIGGLVKG